MSVEIKTEKQAAYLRDLARGQADAHAKVALVLAETLFTIKFSSVKIGGREMSLVEHWGHEDFHEYTEHELGLHGSTAENYAHVHDVLILGEGLKPDALPPSITKLIQLARIAKRPGIKTEAWLKKARDMSCCEFQAAVEEELTGKPSHRQWSFWMDARDVKIVERGIKRAKEILGTTHNGETLSQIVDEWIKVAESNRFRQIRKAG